MAAAKDTPAKVLNQLIFIIHLSLDLHWGELRPNGGAHPERQGKPPAWLPVFKWGIPSSRLEVKRPGTELSF
jgi:hypothetical protein